MAEKDEPKQYTITTIEELINVINESNIDMVIGNLYGMANYWLKLREKYPEVKFKSFTWIDDGKIEVKPLNTFKIILEENQSKP